MTTTIKPLAEINATAVRVLAREMGVVNTARFLNQFTTGYGDYTMERHQMVGEPTVDELVALLTKKHSSETETSP